MNKLVKPIICVSAQMSIAILISCLFIFKICLLVKDFNLVSLLVTLYLAACLLFVVLRVVYNIKTLVDLERENALNLKLLAARVEHIENILLEEEKY